MGRRSRTEFTIAELLAEQSSGSKRYLEFFRVPALSAGIYVLEAGAVDYQTPHSEDEVYFVASGRARLMLEEDGATQTLEVSPGKIIFVAARVRHSFYNITERLQVLVFFAPAESPESAND